MGAKIAFCSEYEGKRHHKFWCTGCASMHVVSANPGVWTWNGDVDRPTIRASVLVTGYQQLTEQEYDAVLAGGKVERRDLRCHSFVTDGRIEYLSDCTHSLAGQTVNMEDVDDKY